MVVQDDILRNEIYTREILLCDSVLQGENDSLLIVPLPRTVQKGEKIVFQALSLVLDQNTIFTSEKLNNKSSGFLDSFSHGLFICQIMRYQTCGDQIYAVVSIHCNQKQNLKGSFVFSFRYWLTRKDS